MVIRICSRLGARPKGGDRQRHTVAGPDCGVVAPVASLNGLLKDTGPAFTPRPLNVTTDDAGMNSVLTAKSDGSYAHLIWRSWADRQPHPITWAYDRAIKVTAWGADGGVFRIDWSKGCGQNSDWLT